MQSDGFQHRRGDGERARPARALIPRSREARVPSDALLFLLMFTL